LADAIDEAGFPPGVINMVVADVAESEMLVSDPGVDKVTFTGSSQVGRHIAQICAGQFKKFTLELGGKSAAIILDDADFDIAIPAIIASGVAANNGESCTAQSRILAPRTHYDAVVEAMAEGVRGLVVGDPSDPQTAVGPMISAKQRDRVESYIQLGEQEGAQVVVGGGRRPPVDSGYYVAPTVFSNASNDMRISREEIFGPVAVVIPYDTEAEAIRMANDSPYGLAGTVWTTDDARGMHVARSVRAGTFCVNTYEVDLNSPFGGYKESGVGREMGPESFEESLQTKSVTFSGASFV
jgi:aldehyde dehydrogenase (NAD+)